MPKMPKEFTDDKMPEEPFLENSEKIEFQKLQKGKINPLQPPSELLQTFEEFA